MLEQTHAQTPAGGYIYHKARHGFGPLNANTSTEKSSKLHDSCWTDESVHWKRDKDQIQMLRAKGRAYQKLPDAVI